ncbi:MAG: hypothetical protein ACRC1T_05010 [Clostridium chrysemydis]|uniref:hypothetical protein n=1 Tax=Clostridium chrysemydis TaxID=2665504 RepID=UPI003F3BD192
MGNLLREDFDHENLTRDCENTRNFQREINRVEKEGIINEFKEYLERNPTLTYEEIEAIRGFIKYEINKIN